VRITLASLTLALTMLPVVGCNQEEPVSTIAEPAAQEDALTTGNRADAVATGKVTETMNAASYTYVCVDTGSENVWAAAPQFEVKVGDEVTIPQGDPMRNFHSNTLDRDFEVIYFVRGILGPNGLSPSKRPQIGSGHPPIADSSAPANIDVSGIAKPDGGKTVAELFAHKSDLSGKEVTVRGKVVKFSANIMGKNWLHLQDGSGDAAAKTNDLTVTTSRTVKLADTVLVMGTLVVEKDFGFGYQYDVMIEEASVTVE
jgi:hypothetical protein